MICIQICAEGEWRAFKNLLGIQQVPEGLAPYETGSTPYGDWVKTEISDQECIFFFSGFTKTRSSGACQHAIDRWKPDRLFVLGTCGGVAEDLTPLDIILGSSTVQYDCIIRFGGSSPVFYEDFVEPLDNAWIDFDQLPFPVREGLIATADQDFGIEQKELLSGKDILCADWESGAISHICRINGVPCTVLRGVTDMPRKEGDQDPYEEQWDSFRRNTPLVMEKLVLQLLPVLVNSCTATHRK